MQRLGLLDAILMVALDSESQSRLSVMAVPFVYRPFDCSDLGGLWVHRLRVVNELLADDISLIHSDADAVWLESPLADWRDSGCDVLFTQGTIWPMQAFEPRGFVACCGCYFIQSNARSRDFMLKALDKCLDARDDQKAINLLMPLSASDWHVEESYELVYRSHRITASKSIMRARAGDLTFGILPHEAYPRLTETDHDMSMVKIAHPLSQKNARDTIDGLKSNSLWFL